MCSGGFNLENVTYQPFCKEDCQEVLELWGNTPGIHLHNNGEDSIDGITAYLERNPYFSFIAKCNCKIIGAIMCGHDGRRGFIHHLAVDIQFRKIGIGKTLHKRHIHTCRYDHNLCAQFVLMFHCKFHKTQWELHVVHNKS